MTQHTPGPWTVLWTSTSTNGWIEALTSEINTRLNSRFMRYSEIIRTSSILTHGRKCGTLLREIEGEK